VITDLLDWLHELPQPGLVGVTGALVMSEATVGLGFLAPGEAALSIAGATADTVPRFTLLWMVATVCSAIGDSLSFALGKRYGPRLRESRLVAKYGAGGWDRATGLMERRGGWAVFVARLIPVVRTVAPAVAGASAMPFRRFFPAVLASGIVWCLMFILLGRALGESATMAESAGGSPTPLLVIPLLVLAFVVRRAMKNRAASRAAR
jgi:membrane protein DedA with SNARE-associated domain